MKAIKYPYGLFISASIIFILGMIHDDLFFPKTRSLHIPMVLYSNFYSLTLVISGFIHLGIYKEDSEIKLRRFSNASIRKFSKIVYWFSILLVIIIMNWFALKYFEIGFYSLLEDIFKSLFFFYLMSHLILLFAWLWIVPPNIN